MLTQYVHCIDLPTSFRTKDVLSFHQRDKLEVAERVGSNYIQKGMIWEGAPTCLSMRFHHGMVRADLLIDSSKWIRDRSAFEGMISRMLGLNQNIEAFERYYRDHHQLGRLIAKHPGLRTPVASTPFEALTWAITGQQISVQAAVALRRKLITATNIRHSNGLLCYPDAKHIAQLTEEQLRQIGFSRAKAKTLATISHMVAKRELVLDHGLGSIDIEAIAKQLQLVHGIGPWTINYTLLRGYGWLDGSLHGDVAVRRGLQMLLDMPEKIGEDKAKKWLESFSPWRALVGAHLWASQSSVIY